MSETPPLLFSVNREDTRPMFEQLCDTIRHSVHRGVLTQNMTLPATRTLAQELAISRSTVVTAYEQLVAEGYLEGKPGAGYVVCAMGDTELPVASSERKRSVAGSKDVSSTAHKEGLLKPSLPDMRLFPHRLWARTVARVCRTHPESMLIGSDSFGYPELRRAIVDHVREWRGLEVSPHQVIVTAGATDALNICFRTLLKPGQSVGLEDPGYRPILRQVTGLGLKPVFMDVDKEGAQLPDIGSPVDQDLAINPQVESDQQLPAIVVLTPSHQYPLGNTMSPQRRWEYIHWAHQHGSWIIEDDYDSEFRYAGRPIPAMAGLDQMNRILYTGSFAKIFSNTLRLGYLIVPDSLTESMRQTMADFGLKASLMPQPALAEFIHSGDFYRHLRRVRKTYSERNKYLVQQLNQRFSDSGQVQDYSAGMKLVFHLKQPFTDTDIVIRANQAGLALGALSESCQRRVDGNGLIMGFAGYNTEEIRQALDILYEVISACQTGREFYRE
ncbi:MocR-like pyridoxine biosynthesis transcription factor PdxR [Oceanospirillum sediminis]|uniref:PLP-dependent aminotransferase family protein n=1 Tax=Oceanospirillum sediminis TaxID=2760088 RepID=A0A839IJP2_9GAMM|nr:PLP-dependent aminotransferase family protein [Oceanospirillum sediminis]MBB1485148.1 PLP-dependent aminotransferase family protein [Oceanospirillum sediminis]